MGGNVWSRSARRKGREQMQETKKEIQFGFRITVHDGIGEEGEGSRVEIEWRMGVDVVLFESFNGKVKSIVQQQ